MALTGDQTGKDIADGLRLKGPLAASGPGDLGQAGEGPEGGRRGVGARPRCRALLARAFFFAFFLHAELQDPQIEKQRKTETKTDQDKKHVCFLQTEVQFVVFSFLAQEGTISAGTGQRW